MSEHSQEPRFNESIEKHCHRGSGFIIIGKLRTQCQQDTPATDSSLERVISAYLSPWWLLRLKTKFCRSHNILTNEWRKLDKQDNKTFSEEK